MAMSPLLEEDFYTQIMRCAETDEQKHERGVQEERQRYRNTLLQMLRLRFGRIPTSAVRRVNALDADGLSALGLRILTAKTLTEALGKPLRRTMDVAG